MKTARTLSWLVAIGGLWELVAPFILKYTATSAAMWDAVIVGIVLIILGVWAALSKVESTMRTLNWINALLGLWLVIAPFVLKYTTVSAALWNDIIVGVVVLVLAIWAAVVAGAGYTSGQMGQHA